MAAYFYRRACGFLIPGCILLGMGLGSVGSSSPLGFGEFGSVGLGVGFVAIFLIAWIYDGRSHWWPLIPGGILIVTGLLLMAGSVGMLGRRDRSFIWEG